MVDEIFRHVGSLGIAGLLFVMWWIERQERTRAAAGMQEALKQTAQIVDLHESLLDVVRTNTEALTALREELQSHRLADGEWRARVAEQLQRLEIRNRPGAGCADNAPDSWCTD